jgi:alkyl hydroperoxide reductase subunit AhpC
MAPNFVTVGVYKNRLGKIRLSDYHGKKYVILFFIQLILLLFHQLN